MFLYCIVLCLLLTLVVCLCMVVNLSLNGFGLADCLVFGCVLLFRFTCLIECYLFVFGMVNLVFVICCVCLLL